MGTTILWTRNRGVQAMTRVVLARRGERPLVVETLAAFRNAMADGPADAVITTEEDLEAVGLDPVLLERMFPVVPLLIVCSARRPLPSVPSPRTRVLPLPFSAADLLGTLPGPVGPSPAGHAVTNSPPPPTSISPTVSPENRPVSVEGFPALPDLQGLIQREVRSLLESTLREWVQRTVREVVPELAESLIREELERILRESEEAALQGPSPEDPDVRPRN